MFTGSIFQMVCPKFVRIVFHDGDHSKKLMTSYALHTASGLHRRHGTVQVEALHDYNERVAFQYLACNFGWPSMDDLWIIYG